MPIIQTNQWLRRYLKQDKFTIESQCEALCKPLLPYFSGADEVEIHQHLLQYGLFPPLDYKKEIEALEYKDVWFQVEREYLNLRKEWKGPDVSIFIFPSNQQIRSLKNEFNGKTGLSFKDKIFLFISSENTLDEWKALLTHEYNHSCRLANFEAEEFNLLQTVILEGTAEKAVEERLGKQWLAPWTSIYSQETAKRLWERYLLPYKNIKSTSPKFQQLLYGARFLPKYVGYNVGYHLVSSYCKNHPTTSVTLLKTTAETILEGSDFS